jgi:DNA-binding MarR family transcriptional regulator
MKLTDNSFAVWNFVHENGGKVSLPEICDALGKGARSVGANVTDLKKKGLAERVKEEVGDETITYVVLTDEGQTFVQGEE